MLLFLYKNGIITEREPLLLEKGAYLSNMAQNCKKRANGEGSIRQRPDGRWEARLMAGHQANGRPRVKSFYGKTQKEVYVKMTAYQDALAQNLNLE